MPHYAGNLLGPVTNGLDAIVKCVRPYFELGRGFSGGKIVKTVDVTPCAFHDRRMRRGHMAFNPVETHTEFVLDGLHAATDSHDGNLARVRPRKQCHLCCIALGCIATVIGKVAPTRKDDAGHPRFVREFHGEARLIWQCYGSEAGCRKKEWPALVERIAPFTMIGIDDDALG